MKMDFIAIHLYVSHAVWGYDFCTTELPYG